MQLPVLSVVALLAHILSLLSLVAAQDSPLWIQGGLESAVATDAAVYNTGGTIVINGFTMTVPKNVLVQFPAAWVPFKDFAASQQKFIGYETLACISPLLISWCPFSNHGTKYRLLETLLTMCHWSHRSLFPSFSRA